MDETVHSSKSSDPAPNLPVFGKYRILGEIGRGGMGLVYRVLHTDLNRVMALKIVKAGTLAEAAQLKMFQREIETLAAVNHPNIISIHDVGESGGQHFYVMDFIDGCTLEDLLNAFGEEKVGHDSSTIKEAVTQVQTLKAGGTVLSQKVRMGKKRALNLNQALDIMQKVLSALDHAHRRGIIHRDIKPSNIMLTKEGEPVLMDFGLARQVDAAETARVTQTGQIMGTPMYMSPEQAGGQKDKITEKSDIYSMGALFYEMLTGRPLIVPTGNVLADIKAVLDKDPVPVRRLNRSVPREVEIICLKALEKEPDRRYRSAAIFAADIARYLKGDTILARPQSSFYWLRKKVLKHKVVSATVAVLLLVLLGWLGYWYSSSKMIRAQELALAEEKAKAEARWILDYENDFNSGALDSANWFCLRPDLNNMTYAVENKALVLRNKGTLFSTLKVPGNIKIVFDALADSGNEIIVKLKGDSSYGNRNLFYEFFWGANISKWRKKGMWEQGEFKDEYFAQENTMDDLVMSPGIWHRLEISYEDGLCRARVDGQTVCESKDAFPLNGLDNRRFGFASLLGKYGIDNLKVYRQVLAQRVDITRVADVYIEQKQFEQAMNQLLDILANYEDAAVISLILGKISALDQIAPDLNAFILVLSRRQLMDKIFSAADSEALDGFMEKAVNVAAENGTQEVLVDLDYAARKYQGKLSGIDLFHFDVYMGLALHKVPEPSFQRRYFNQALAVRQDTVVARYVREGVVPQKPIRAGKMILIPAVYLPQRFGRCTYVPSFFMDSSEATLDRFSGLYPVDSTRYYYDSKKMPFSELTRRQYPAAGATFYDAVLCCNIISRREGLDTCYSISNRRDTTYDRKTQYTRLIGSRPESFYSWEKTKERIFSVEWDKSRNGYRLPALDEFEYALRAGSAAEYFWGLRMSPADDYAWFRANAGDHLHPVAAKRPNGFGLYDMAGNVREWCWDSDKWGYRYLHGAQKSSNPKDLRSGYWVSLAPFERDYVVGFRFVRNAR